MAREVWVQAGAGTAANLPPGKPFSTYTPHLYFPSFFVFFFFSLPLSQVKKQRLNTEDYRTN
jgi:hypothetical protein